MAKRSPATRPIEDMLKRYAKLEGLGASHVEIASSDYQLALSEMAKVKEADSIMWTFASPPGSGTAMHRLYIGVDFNTDISREFANWRKKMEEQASVRLVSCESSNGLHYYWLYR